VIRLLGSETVFPRAAQALPFHAQGLFTNASVLEVFLLWSLDDILWPETTEVGWVNITPFHRVSCRSYHSWVSTRQVVPGSTFLCFHKAPLSAWTVTHRKSFFGAVVGVEFRALCLLGRCSTTWTMPPAVFSFSYFFRQGLTFLLWGWPGAWSSYLYLTCSWDHRCVP
jgi:hypothetical protein